MLKKVIISLIIGTTSLYLTAGSEKEPTEISECNKMYNLARKHTKLLGTTQAELDKMVEKMNKSSESKKDEIKHYCEMMLVDAQRIVNQL